MAEGWLSKVRWWQSDRVVLYECRRCGTSTRDRVTTCTNCGTRSIARYEIS